MAHDPEKGWKREEGGLPPPALAVPGRTRFSQPNRMKVRWEKLKRRIGNGSAPDDSLGDPTTETSDTESALVRTRTGSRSAFSEKDDGFVDTVVVENEGRYCQWKEGQVKASTTGASDPMGTEQTPPTFSGGLYHPSDFASSRNTAFHNAGALGRAYDFVRWYIWPRVHHFLFLRYHDEALEDAFLKERWWQQKSTHIFGGAFLTLNWVLGTALLPKPWSLFNKITWYGVVPALTLPIAPMAAFDVPRRRPWFWQLWILAIVLWLSIMNPIDMRVCDYYRANPHCGTKDFMASLYYATGTPLLALFALGMWRLTAIVALLGWVGAVAGLILPDRPGFARNLVNVFVLLVFMLYVHFRRDSMDRRVYTLRAELKVQFRAKQKSQINERKASDSKRRLTSYIFHEVRVPLNTALLAVQNLEAVDAFKKDSEQAIEYVALQGSLQMMSQVLNDVLDFSRMERGGFTSVSRPFSLHGAMRSVFGPLKLDANARGLALVTHLDPRIDEVARVVLGLGTDIQEVDGYVLGDEMRLRQIINNLCSNACKFTPAGGKITVTTKLIFPVPEQSTPVLDEKVDPDVKEVEPTLTPLKLHQHDQEESDLVVVRFEITDTGFGIHPRDMAENRLFSPYIQSELGRRQGGKGTGLGLSLVRNIVMLSGGRLGVRSKLNSGSTFWIEMPFSIGKAVAQALAEDGKTHPLYSPTQGTLSTTTSGLSSPSELAYVPTLKHTSSDTSFSRPLETAVAAVEAAPSNFLFSTALPNSQPLRNPNSIQLGPVHAIKPDVTVDELIRPPTKPIEHAHSAPITVTAPSAGSDHSHGSATTVAPPVAVPEAKSTPLNVLVVDDDMLTRRLMTRMMERLGVHVTAAENGQVALEYILKDKAQDPQKIIYDVIFLDNQMPLVSGLQVASRLRGADRHDFIVGVTANAQLAEQEEYIERGANFVLTKPVLEADLKRMLTIAENRRAERQKSNETSLAEILRDASSTQDEGER